jgi:hypothetical protein
MLTELYIEALLVDEELADMVWEAWDVGLIPDEVAAMAWWLVVRSGITERWINPPTKNWPMLSKTHPIIWEIHNEKDSYAPFVRTTSIGKRRLLLHMYEWTEPAHLR